jgi:hypothetical protein
MEGIEQKSKPDFLRWLLVGLVVLVGLGIIGGGIFVYQKTLKNKKDKEAVTPTPTPFVDSSEITPVEEISPSPTSKIARTDLKIKILNGTGVPGAAAKAAELLEKLGWQGIKTGNADNFDYQKTVIQIKESKKEYFGLLKEDLSSKYSLEEEPQTLSEEDKFDAVIIVGKE